MARPTFRTAPTADELAALADPVDRFTAISRFSRLAGTLPRWLARRRDEDIRLIVAADSHTLTALAATADISLGRMSQLVKRALSAPTNDSARSGVASAGRAPVIQEV